MNKYFAIGLAAISLSIASCQKPESPQPAGASGNTFFKIQNNGETLLALDLKSQSQSAMLLDLRKDANSESNLNKAATVELSLDQALLDAFNTKNNAHKVVLPSSMFSTSPALTNGKIIVPFAQGQHANEVVLTIPDATKMDLTKEYVLPLTITAVDAYGKISERKSALVSVVAKNKYHGQYQAKGVFTHPINGDRVIDRAKDLNTAGPTSVKAELGDLGGSGYYMILTVNPDNSVTITPAGVTPNIDQHWGNNYYDPATKSFHLYYSYNIAAPRIVQEVITLK